jgi:hypothetical protein
MKEKAVKAKGVQGKTYSLYGDDLDSTRYYDTVRSLTDAFLEHCPDEKKLLTLIQLAEKKKSFRLKHSPSKEDQELISYIRKSLKESLSEYTRQVKQHLKTIPLSQRFDPIIKTNEEQYHLFMIEIELTNRINKHAFRESAYKFALIAHCLRDFRPDCASENGEIEHECAGCTEDCFIHLGSHIMKKYDIYPYISVTMDLKKLFKELKTEHQDIGALGIACVPELVHGMRLCMETGIIPVGIPLDANRCARWMKQAHESSFSIKELEALLGNA